MSENNIRVFAGTSCPALAEQVAHHLDMSLGRAVVEKFADGEANIEIKQNVRGREVFIIQSTCAPVNDNLMQLTIMADALRRASAASITAVVPYFGYARQDRRVRSARVPISAKVVADLMACVGISRLITVDLHADQIQGFFSIPVDNVYASTPMLEDMYKLKNHKELVVVSPDVGGVVRARAVAKRINTDTDLAIIDKRRPAKNKAQVMNVIGEVSGRDCVIVDDIIDTAGTMCAAANALMEQGAKSVRAYVTHPVLSGSAIENIEQSGLAELVVTDTIPLSAKAEACEKIRQISLSSLIAETISRITHKQSVSSMFE